MRSYISYIETHVSAPILPRQHDDASALMRAFLFMAAVGTVVGASVYGPVLLLGIGF